MLLKFVAGVVVVVDVLSASQVGTARAVFVPPENVVRCEAGAGEGGCS